MDIFGLSARDFAAFWGAGLSTLLVLAKLLHPRPTVTLHTIQSGMSHPIYRLRVSNNSKHPVVLGRIKVFGTMAAIQTGSIDGWDVRDAIHYALKGKLNIQLEPSKTLSLDLVCVPEPKWLLLAITWRSHRMIAWPLFPSLLMRCSGALKALQDHPLPEN